MILKGWAIFILCFSVLGFGISAANADDVLVTIEVLETGEHHHFSDADLLALPQVEFETTTTWTSGVNAFSGPSLKTLLDAVDEKPAKIRIYAINDYSVEFPVADIEDDAPILANRIDGEPFSIREKGPLWIVFPYDKSNKYQAERIYALSVWQVSRIVVLPE